MEGGGEGQHPSRLVVNRVRGSWSEGRATHDAFDASDANAAVTTHFDFAHAVFRGGGIHARVEIQYPFTDLMCVHSCTACCKAFDVDTQDGGQRDRLCSEPHRRLS